MSNKYKRKIIEEKKTRFRSVEVVSEKISKTTRYLAIAGTGAAWILINFGLSQSICNQVKNNAIISIYLFACTIMFEYLHLLIQWIFTLLYSTILLYKKKNEKIQINKIPSYTKWVAWIIWMTKILCLLTGYIYLLLIIQKI